MFESRGAVLLLAALILGTSLPVHSRRMPREAAMEKQLVRLQRQIHDTTHAPFTPPGVQETTRHQEDTDEGNQVPGYSYEHLITPFYAGGYRPNPNSEPTQRTEQQGLPGDGNQSGSSTGFVQQPSPCVWAIVACCTTDSTDVHNNCFEQLGCEGAWWDNPCHSTLSAAALSSVLNFYQEGGLK